MGLFILGWKKDNNCVCLRVTSAKSSHLLTHLSFPLVHSSLTCFPLTGKHTLSHSSGTSLTHTRSWIAVLDFALDLNRVNQVVKWRIVCLIYLPPRTSQPSSIKWVCAAVLICSCCSGTETGTEYTGTFPRVTGRGPTCDHNNQQGVNHSMSR